MRSACLLLAALALGLAGSCPAQGILSDLMSGKLVNPEVGAYAWYTLKDSATGQEYYLRQAVVGAEKVKRKDGYWLETELVPRIGFSSVYKMLLTGPASDPRNVHRLLVREGDGAVQEVSLEDVEGDSAGRDAPREPAGTETLSLPAGEIATEHYVIDENGQKTELWISQTIPPMGLVKMVNGEGELVLQRFGKGGKDGQSALGSTPPTVEGGDEEVEAATEEEAPRKGRKSNITVRKRTP